MYVCACSDGLEAWAEDRLAQQLVKGAEEMGRGRPDLSSAPCIKDRNPKLNTQRVALLRGDWVLSLEVGAKRGPGARREVVFSLGMRHFE